MRVLGYGITLFLVSFLIHLFLWKVRLPKGQIASLLRIFLGTLIIGIFVLLGSSSSLAVYEYLQLFFLFTSLTLAYIASYTAVQADSPSLVIVMDVGKAGPQGLEREALERKMDEGFLVAPRVRDLVVSNLAYLDGGVYKLTRKGVIMARLFTLYRKILKREKGG